MSNYRFILEEQKKLVITRLEEGRTPVDIETINVHTIQCVR